MKNSFDSIRSKSQAGGGNWQVGSSTLFTITKRKNTLRVIHFSKADSWGSNGAIERPSRTTGCLLPDSVTRDVDCSHQDQFALGPKQDLARTDLERGLERWLPWWFMYATTDGSHWDLGGSISKPEIQAIYGNLCAIKDGPRPLVEWPSRTAPQNVREVSVVNVLRWHDGPNIGPWAKNQGLFHITRVCKHLRVTLIKRNGLPLGENPLVFASGLIYANDSPQICPLPGRLQLRPLSRPHDSLKGSVTG